MFIVNISINVSVLHLCEVRRISSHKVSLKLLKTYKQSKMLVALLSKKSLRTEDRRARTAALMYALLLP